MYSKYVTRYMCTMRYKLMQISSFNQITCTTKRAVHACSNQVDRANSSYTTNEINTSVHDFF